VVLTATREAAVASINSNGDRGDRGEMDNDMKSALTPIPTVGILSTAAIGSGQIQMLNILTGLVVKKANLVGTMAMDTPTFIAVVDGNATRIIPNRNEREALVTLVKTDAILLDRLRCAAL